MTQPDDRRPVRQADAQATATFLHWNRRSLSVVATAPTTIRLAVACVAAGGHLLVEDHPGLGKTTLAKALAGTLGLGFNRLQCTADLLPADVVGATVLGPDGTQPTFRPGPVFTNVLMADELNRASPRSQSALLEAMEEHQVSVDGETHALPAPFFVLATQNPFDATGTSPLPHGQRDRFLVRLMLGYPSRTQMDAMLAGPDPADTVRHVRPSVTPDELSQLMTAVAAVHLAPPVRGYILDLVESTRAHPLVAVGASPRAAARPDQGLLRSRGGVRPELRHTGRRTGGGGAFAGPPPPPPSRRGGDRWRGRGPGGRSHLLHRRSAPVRLIDG